MRKKKVWGPDEGWGEEARKMEAANRSETYRKSATAYAITGGSWMKRKGVRGLVGGMQGRRELTRRLY